MSVYVVTAVRVTRTRFGNMSEQVPAFLLDGNIQGISSEGGAVRIARAILPDSDKVTYHIDARDLGNLFAPAASSDSDRPAHAGSLDSDRSG